MNCAQAQRDLQSSLQTSGELQSSLSVMSLCPESLWPLPEFAQIARAFFVHCVCAVTLLGRYPAKSRWTVVCVCHCLFVRVEAPGV